MPNASLGGVAIEHGLSSSQLKKARARIDAAHKVTRSRFDGLDAAIKLGDHCAQRDHIAWLTTDANALLSHAVKANARTHPARRASEACLAVPGKADAEKPIAEPVGMYAKPKAGGFRAIHEFGVVHRAIQFGIRQVGSRYFTPRSFQYTHKGVPEAICAVKKALLNGHVHVAEIDIKRFFSSFLEDRLLDEFTLPKTIELPEGVVKHAVFSRLYEAGWKDGGLRGVPSSFLPQLYAEARSGLSTGSGCSPIIATITVSKLAWPAKVGVFLVNYLDNFLLLASSKALLEGTIGELTVAIGQLPSGHFEVKEVFRSRASEGFDFLGHRLHLAGGAVRVAPTEGNFHDFCTECDKLDTKLSDCLFYPSRRDIPQGIRLAVDELDYVSGFIDAFRECDPAHLEFYKDQGRDVFATLHRAGVSDDQIAKIVMEKGASGTEHQVYQ